MQEHIIKTCPICKDCSEPACPVSISSPMSQLGMSRELSTASPSTYGGAPETFSRLENLTSLIECRHRGPGVMVLDFSSLHCRLGFADGHQLCLTDSIRFWRGGKATASVLNRTHILFRQRDVTV